MGACGAIGVVNLHNYLVHLREHHRANINIILTRSASEMVQMKVLHAITGNVVFGDDVATAVPAPAINLGMWAEAFIILPASANIIGKAANGIADDLLSTTVLAAKTPIFFVPSMNTEMWKKPVVQRNLRQLKTDGHHVLVRKKSGFSFEVSSGRSVPSDLMPDPVELIESIDELWSAEPEQERPDQDAGGSGR